MIFFCAALVCVPSLNVCIFLFQPVSSRPDLVAMAAQRQAKIERYRQRKELEAKLLDVRRAVDSGQADDEVIRDFYLLSVRRWVTVCLEDVESIDQELLILKNMDSLKEGAASQPPQPSAPTMKPFILTRDALQVSTLEILFLCPLSSFCPLSFCPPDLCCWSTEGVAVCHVTLCLFSVTQTVFGHILCHVFMCFLVN